jgi:putative flippase GtrA
MKWDNRQFLKFIAVGILNTIVGYGLFALFIFLGLHYTLASFIGTILGILFNFRTIGQLVFNNRDKHRLPLFFGVYAIIYVIGILGLKLLGELGLDMYQAGLVMILPTASIAYLLNRRFVFGGKR